MMKGRFACSRDRDVYVQSDTESDSVIVIVGPMGPECPDVSSRLVVTLCFVLNVLCTHAL